jgi:putative protein-disulfide isomerase
MADRFSKIIYVGDPMCSWCWGFAPEIESLAQDHEVEVVVGGLRPGPMARELDDRMASSLAHHWQLVSDQTGQPFDTAFLERRDGWVYDTEPAATAVTTLRSLDESATLGYFTDIQKAFYGRGEDVTRPTVLAGLTAGLDIDHEMFASTIQTEEARKAAWRDFSRARNWGIAGFPSLVGELDDGRLVLLSRGWAKADVIRGRMLGVVREAE